MTTLEQAFDALLAAASTDDFAAPPAGEWSATQVLAHVSLITAATVATASTVAAGGHAAYDNRLAQDIWTIDRLAGRAGGVDGLRERLRRQAGALDACVAALGEEELDTPVPALLLSGNAALLDQPLALRDIIGGLAESELPGHTAQLRALTPAA